MLLRTTFFLLVVSWTIIFLCDPWIDRVLAQTFTEGQGINSSVQGASPQFTEQNSQVSGQTLPPNPAGTSSIITGQDSSQFSRPSGHQQPNIDTRNGSPAADRGMPVNAAPIAEKTPVIEATAGGVSPEIIRVLPALFIMGLLILGVHVWWCQRRTQCQLDVLISQIDVAVSSTKNIDGEVQKTAKSLETISGNLSRPGASRASPSGDASSKLDLEPVKKALDQVLAQLKEKPQAVEGNSRALQSEVDSLRREKTSWETQQRDLRERESRVASSEATLQSRQLVIAEKSKELAEQMRSLEKAADQQKRDAESNQRRSAELDRLQRDVESKAEEAARLNQLNDQRQRDLDAIKTDLDAKSSALVDRRRQIDTDRNALDEHLKALWPEPFATGALAAWKERLETRWMDDRSSARLLWLAIARYQSLRLRQDALEIPRALRELGRAAYQFWDEEKISEEHQSRAAREWASALEPQLEGRYFLRVPEVGEPKDSGWMSYPNGGGPSVLKVQAWCVQNDKRIAVEKALVA